MDNNQINKQDVELNETNLVALILAFFLPPIGVAIKDGFGLSLFVNILLTFLGFVPGVLHAVFVILRK